MVKLSLISGTAHPGLAESIAGCLGIEPGERRIEAFPDDERLHI
jgi:phosphoribosylpyrophosphate synthetase